MAKNLSGSGRKSDDTHSSIKKQNVSFLTILFRFSTKTDRILMAIGLICAGAAGGNNYAFLF